MHNMHVHRFQDSNERTDKNPWLGLWRVSVKRGVGVYLFLKNVVLGLGLGLTLTLTLTLNNSNLTITLTLKQHSLKKNRPRPRPRVLLTPVCEENCGRGQAQSPWRFFLPKSALFCDKISDVMIFGRPLCQWMEGEVDLIKMRYLHAVWRSAPFFLLFLDFHFFLEVVVPQDDNRNCWSMLKTTEHHRSFSNRIKVALTTDSRPKPPSLSYPAFQCISVRGV